MTSEETIILEYKGYHSTPHYDAESRIVFGKIDGIRDLITYECDPTEPVATAFMEAVDDYLSFCAQVWKEPQTEDRSTSP